MAKLKKISVPFTQVANIIINDKKLSLKAKGLFSYLYSKPDGWNFSSERIALENSDGRDSIRQALRELEDNGYLERKKQASGRIEHLLKFDEKPETENPSVGQEPETEKPTVGKTHSGKTRPISNKDTDNNKYTENKIATEAVAPQMVNDLIDLFKEVNPSYERLFPNKTERSAAERLISKFGFDKVGAAVKSIPRFISLAGCPQITTPYQFERKLGQYVAFVKQSEKTKKFIFL